MAAYADNFSASSVDFDEETSQIHHSSFGMERIRSSSIDGYHSKNFTDKIYEYPDWNASTMGVNRTGKIAILAARKGFMVIDFDNPTKRRKINCNIKWEPGCLQWNPHQLQEERFATVMNQKTDIWNVVQLSGSSSPLITLAGHTRAISDIDWNYYDPDLLLTCSMDTYINLWDLRESRRPASTFTTVAGSSQVKWNRKNKYLFGSAHDGDIRIWDTRKGNIPTVYIAGHLSKIHGLDWCPQKEEYFVTASNDCTVKFWNMNSPKQPRASINNGAPVWKARYTPFGNGLVTMLVPKINRTDNTLCLWNTAEVKSAVHKFNGHTDVILEFQWRSQRRDDYDEYQLVSWSKDQTLRLWRASKKIVQALTGEPYTRLSEDSPLSPTDSILDPLHFDNKPKLKSNESPGTPPMMSSTYKETASLVSANTKSSGTSVTSEKRSNSASSVLSSASSPRQSTTRVTTPERPEQLTLMDLKLIDTKPLIPMSPGRKSPPNRSLSPLSGNRTAFRKHEQFSPPSRRGIVDYMTPAQALRQEFTLLNLNSPVFKIEKMDSDGRLCLITSRATLCYFKLQITFPLSYPDKIPPNFQFSKDSKINDEVKEKIIMAMTDVSEQHVKFNRPCLEPCLRQLRYLIEELHENDVNLDVNHIPMNTPNLSYPFKRGNTDTDSSYMDSTVPFPRTCGARFCSVGDILVVFSRPEKYNNIVVVERSLRSMSALNSYLENLDDQCEENEPGSYKRPKSIGLVYVSNTSVLIPISKELARSYALTGDDPAQLCLKNASLAASVGRRDLVQTWTLLAQVMNKDLTPDAEDDLKTPWACHPFGRNLINSLFDYYERLKDVQTLAMMSCMLAKQHIPGMLNEVVLPMEEERKITKRNSRYSSSEDFSLRMTSSPDYSPYNLYEKVSMDDSSWTPPFVEEKPMDPEEVRRKQHYRNCRFLDPVEMFRYDQFKRNYAEILYRWDFQTQRTEILKFCSEQPDENEGLKFEEICLECFSCQNSQRKPCCINCKSIIVKCSVCRVGVRGLLSFCMVCGHGGHMFHLIDWFQKNDWCATGCGCYCLRIGQFSSQP